MYWDITSRYEPVAHVISRDRFEMLKKYLHFADNHSPPHNVQDESKDRLFKIRPLFERFKKSCVKQISEEQNSTDEQMVPFEGRSFLRRYMPNKPNKWGFKIFSCNGSSGQVCDFDLEGAPDPMNPKMSKKLGYCGADIVLKLTGHIPNNKDYKLYFDNYFTYIELLIEIKKYLGCRNITQ